MAEEMTDKELQMLESLRAKEVRIEAAAAEAQRQVLIAALAPVNAALGGADSVRSVIDALRSARGTVSLDSAMRIDRLVTVLSIDALALLAATEAAPAMAGM